MNVGDRNEKLETSNSEVSKTARNLSLHLNTIRGKDMRIHFSTGEIIVFDGI